MPDFDALLKMRKPKGEPVEMVKEEEQDKIQTADYTVPDTETPEKNIINISNTKNKQTSNQSEFDEDGYETENTVKLELVNPKK